MTDCSGVIVAVVAAVQGLLFGYGTHKLGMDALEPKKPNFLIIFADDMGYNDIGYNNPYVKTPTLDRLAREGVTLTQAYSAIACSPSRASLLTSYFPHRVRFQHNVLADGDPLCLPSNTQTIAERLQKLGYGTSLVGKWHGGFCKESCLPTSRGFDQFYGFYTGGINYYQHKAGGEPIRGHDWKNYTTPDLTTVGEFNSDIITRYAKRMLEENAEKDEPFFMFLSYFNPHLPLTVEKKYSDLYLDNGWGEERAKYLGLVTNLDDQVEKVMQTLKATGLYENTLILFASDNGGQTGGMADNSPFRGSKCSLFEGGSRIPLFFHGPMLEKKGTKHNGMFHFTDIAPTFVSMAGGTIEEAVDGIDQSEMIVKGKESKRDSITYQLNMNPRSGCGQAGYRKGDMKLIWGTWGMSSAWGKDNIEYWRDPAILATVNLTQTLAPAEGYHDGYVPKFTQADLLALRLVAMANMFRPNDINSGNAFLFNLTADPEERVNLAEVPRYRGILMEMKGAILQKLGTEYNPPSDRQIVPDPASDPDLYGGEFSPGWCNNSTFTIDI